jgi:hypothetical protein
MPDPFALPLPNLDPKRDAPGEEPRDALPPQIPDAAGNCPPCPAPKAKPEKEKRKKPKRPRAICYRGTYRERSKGLSKFKKEQIPCQ